MAREKETMILFEECPVCGGEMVVKQVEKLLRGGLNTATVEVSAEVCLHCGERLYSEDTVRCFERIREKLKRDEVAGFQHMGRSFRVTSCDLERTLVDDVRESLEE
jgi:YgiT-type zinc finger domain-containing protein